jgi:hypothetical protein
LSGGLASHFRRARLTGPSDRIRCNARATLRLVHGRFLKCTEPDAAIGSGVVGRRTFNDAAIGDQADPGFVPIRPSGNAALGETMTSTAPHLSVRGRRIRRLGAAAPASQ